VLVASVIALAATLVAPMAAWADGSPPVLTAVTPNTGFTAGGATVTLTGSGFTGTSEVTFGGVSSPSVTVVSDAELTVATPAHPSAKVGVVVTTPAGSSPASSTTAYTYVGPYVMKVTPTTLSIAGGTVAVTGSGFAHAVAVQIGSTPAVSFRQVTNMVLSVVLPSQPVGTEDVRVTTAVGTTPPVAADRVKFVLPVLNNIMPISGPANRTTAVQLTGNGFIGATEVDFGSVAAPKFSVHGPTAIAVMAPPEAAGTVAVTVVSPAGVTAVTSLDYFTYKPPTITRVSPATGPAAGGTAVLIKGTLFGGTSAVTFGGVPATSLTVVSGGIVAVSPPHLAGMVDVAVTSSAGTTAAVAADHFTYV
jgi:hypothetical protein